MATLLREKALVIAAAESARNASPNLTIAWPTHRINRLGMIRSDNTFGSPEAADAIARRYR
jgi:hypothetical protein